MTADARQHTLLRDDLERAGVSIYEQADRGEDREQFPHRGTGRQADGPDAKGEPIEHAIAIMMEAHWRSAVHPDRVESIGAFNDDREPAFADPDH